VLSREEGAFHLFCDRAYSPIAGWAGDEGMGADSPMDRSDTEPESGGDVSESNIDEAMSRHEERLQVGIPRREADGVRLRIYAVTERVTQKVPVSHQKVRVRRQPITDDQVGAAISGAETSEEERGVTRDERPVVPKKLAPGRTGPSDRRSPHARRPSPMSLANEAIQPQGDNAGNGIPSRHLRHLYVMANTP
jgi:hypothetical protein